MMQTLRRNTRIILFIVVAAFVLLIFFDWGLNVTGLREEKVTDIAKVDGKPISYTYWLQYVQAKEAQDPRINRDEIWYSLLDDLVWDNLIQKERIRAVDDEIWAIIKSNPPRQLYDSPYLKNEKGEFDLAKYQQLIAQPESRTWLLEYETNLRRELPREKLRSLVATMGWISPFEDSLTAVEQTTRYDLSFLALSPYRLRGTIAATDDELRQYYEQNIKDYSQPAMATLKFVFFDKQPTSADTVESRERMEDVLARVAEGDTFLNVCRQVSDDTAIVVTFTDEKTLPAYVLPVYKGLKDNQLSGIVSGPDGYLVIQRIKKGQIYQCRATIKVSLSTLGDIHDRIETFKEAVKSTGWDITVKDYNLNARSTYPVSADKINLPLRTPDALKGFLTKLDPKEIAGPLASIAGYYVFMVDSIIPAKTMAFEEVKTGVKAGYERVKMKDVLAARLAELNNRIRGGVSLEQIAAEDTTIMFQNKIKGMLLAEVMTTYGPEFAGTIAALEAGRISSPLVTEWAGYLIRCDAKTMMPFDSTMLGMMQYKRQLRLQGISQAIFTPKKIVDNRDQFFE